jgi:Ca-activated chloride channel family protein
MFRFANIEFLYLLLLAPVLIGAWLYALRRRAANIARFGDAQTVQGLMPENSPRRARNKFLILLIAFCLATMALARPQFGSKLREVKRTGIEIMLCVDVSNSMMARDFEPDRLERTKNAIGRLLEGLQNDQVGLIAFAGDAYIQLPITSDYLTARTFAQQLSTDMVSRQGTAIGAAIDLAAGSFSEGSEGSRVIIVISDGENHADDPVAAAVRAYDKGISIYTIGIGTPKGAPIPVGDDFIRDQQGEIVVTHLDEQTLKQVALTSGGAYIRSDERSVGLQEVIAEVNKTKSMELSSMVFEEYNEQYQYIAAIALVLLLLESVILPRKNRLLARFDVFK